MVKAAADFSSSPVAVEIKLLPDFASTDSGQATSVIAFSLSPTGFVPVGLCFKRDDWREGWSCPPEPRPKFRQSVVSKTLSALLNPRCAAPRASRVAAWLKFRRSLLATAPHYRSCAG